MTSAPETVARTGRIVVGVDGSAGSRAALRFGADEARLRDAVVVPTLVETLDPEDVTQPRKPAVEAGMSSLAMLLTAPAAGVAMEYSPPLEVPGGSRRLDRVIAEELGPVPSVPVAAEVWEGHPGRVLAERSAAAVVLVVGARGTGGFRGLRLGSVAQQVVHRASCPVAVVPRSWRPGEAGHGRVLAGFDVADGLSPATPGALRLAAEEAGLRAAPLEVMVVTRRGRRADTSARVHEIERLLAEEVGRDVALKVATGNLAKALVDASRGALLLVLAGGRAGDRGLEPGSVRHQVVHHAECPVVVVGPPHG